MKIYTILLALVLPSCESNKKPESEVEAITTDQGLRSLLSVGSINAYLDVPSGSNSYIVTTLEFEDGELVRRGAMVSGGTESDHDTRVPVQLTWGRIEGVGRSSLVIPGVQSRSEDKFWIRFVSSSGYGDDQYDGFQLLGLGQSEETRPGSENTGYGSVLDEALKDKRYVGILVGRVFETKEERDKFSESYFEKIIKRQKKSEMATPRKPSD